MNRSDRKAQTIYKIPCDPWRAQNQDRRAPRLRQDWYQLQLVPNLRIPTVFHTISWWSSWLALVLPARLSCVGWFVLQDERAYRAREATGPWMEDPCSAPPSATYTLTLPLPYHATVLHICHFGNGKKEGRKEQWRHGKRSAQLTINCVATWRLRKTERKRD